MRKVDDGQKNGGNNNCGNKTKVESVQLGKTLDLDLKFHFTPP